VNFFSTVALVAHKDLLVETRSREVIYTSVLFAISCILVFSFGLVKEGRIVADAAAAILWITIAFAGTLALNRIFDRERQNETLRALLAWLTMLIAFDAVFLTLSLWTFEPVMTEG